MGLYQGIISDFLRFSRFLRKTGSETSANSAICEIDAAEFPARGNRETIRPQQGINSRQSGNLIKMQSAAVFGGRLAGGPRPPTGAIPLNLGRRSGSEAEAEADGRIDVGAVDVAARDA